MRTKLSDIDKFVKDLIFSEDIRNTEALYCREKQWFTAGTKVCDSDLYVIESKSIFYFRFKKSRRFSVSSSEIPDELSGGVQEEIDKLKASISDIDALRKAMNAILKPIVKEHLDRKEQLRIATIQAQEEEKRRVKEKFEEYMKDPLHWRDDKLQNQINFAMLKKTIAHEMMHDDFFEVMFNNSNLITCVYDSNRNEAALIKKGEVYILYCDSFGSCSGCDAIYGATWKEALAFCKSVANDALCFSSIQDVITFLNVIKDYGVGFFRFSDLANKLISAISLILDFNLESKELKLKSKKEIFDFEFRYDDDLDGYWINIFNKDRKKICTVFFGIQESLSQLARKIANELEFPVILSDNARIEDEERKKYINEALKEGHKINFDD